MPLDLADTSGSLQHSRASHQCFHASHQCFRGLPSELLAYAAVGSEWAVLGCKIPQTCIG